MVLLTLSLAKNNCFNHTPKITEVAHALFTLFPFMCLVRVMVGGGLRGENIDTEQNFVMRYYSVTK